MFVDRALDSGEKVVAAWNGSNNKKWRGDTMVAVSIATKIDGSPLTPEDSISMATQFKGIYFVASPTDYVHDRPTQRLYGITQKTYSHLPTKIKLEDADRYLRSVCKVVLTTLCANHSNRHQAMELYDGLSMTFAGKMCPSLVECVAVGGRQPRDQD